jgi:hypothetical protein
MTEERAVGLLLTALGLLVRTRAWPELSGPQWDEALSAWKTRHPQYQERGPKMGRWMLAHRPSWSTHPDMPRHTFFPVPGERVTVDDVLQYLTTAYNSVG